MRSAGDATARRRPSSSAGFDLRGLGRADTVNLAEFFVGGLGQTADTVEVGQQPFGKPDGALALVADTEDDGQQLGRTQGGRLPA